MSKIQFAIFSLGLLGGGCTLAPKYERPVAPVPAAWSSAATAAAAHAPVHGTEEAPGWRDFFGDPRLQRLIELALTNNRDLLIAALRVEQTRAQFRIQRSELFPGVQGEGSLNRQKFSGAATTFNGGNIITTYSLSVGASYEVDLFGRVRSLKQAALDRYLATEEARKSVQLALVSEVASEYLTQLRLREAKAVAQQTLETVQASRDLIQRRFAVGAASELELRTAEGQVQSVRVNAAGFLQLLAESENALAVLIGGPVPNDLPAGQPFREQRLLTQTPGEIPSDVLQRRPDILAAEHALQAAQGDIGAARAAFFPRILLTGSAGTASASLGDLFSGPSATWSFSPQIIVPIFDVGGTRARLAATKIAGQIELATYEKAIQNAFREVANALAVRSILEVKLQAQDALLRALQSRFELTEARYRQGVDSYVEVLLAQQELSAAQQNVLQYQVARLLNDIALFRALGGGWKS